MQTAQFVEASVRNSDALDTGVLIARLVFGLTLSAHGAQKLFGWFGGNSLTATGGFFEQLGFRPGRLFAGLYQAAPPCSPGRIRQRRAWEYPRPGAHRHARQ